MILRFKNAQDAFEYTYDYVLLNGEDRGDSTSVYDYGFLIENPLDMTISTPWRKWSPKYAEREWEWYLSKNRSVEELKKFAPIWDKMHNGDNIVNSNYGYQWSRNEQLQLTINELKKNPKSRRAVVSIFDGKEKDMYEFDTPCTLSITFTIKNDNRLHMSVIMRSNDLVYGFCNDQYAFAKLQEYVSKELGIEVGEYFHFSSNMHIYHNCPIKKIEKH